MSLLRSTKGATAVTAAVILLACLLGPVRSVGAIRADAWQVYLSGQYGDGHSVMADLEARRATCANLYTVAQRYLDSGSPHMTTLAACLDQQPVELYAPPGLPEAAQDVLADLDRAPLSDQDAKYVSGFRQELESRAFSIAHDPYTEAAHRFNEETLTTLGGRIAGLLGVEPLPTF